MIIIFFTEETKIIYSNTVIVYEWGRTTKIGD